MKVLPLDLSDPLAFNSLKRMHSASGFDYGFPRYLETPLFPIKRIVVDETKANKPLAAAALKVEPEAYLWLDQVEGTPETRLQAIQMLSADLEETARKIGWDQVHCCLPPEIADRFGKRLEDMGWRLARPWPIYVFQLR